MDRVLEQLLIGSMLGDGHIEKPNLNGTPRFREGHSIAQRKYLVWKAKILSNYFKVKIYEGKNNLGKKTVNLYTSCSSELFKLFNLFYPGGIKRKLISVDALRELDDFGLAIWYMDDGCYDKVSVSGRVCIAIHKKNKDVVSKWFVKQGFNPYFSERKDEGKKDCVSVIFGIKDTEIILNRIRKYMCPSMKYKFIFTNEEKEKSRLVSSMRGKEYYKKNKDKKKKYYEENKARISERKKVRYAEQWNPKKRKKRFD